MLKKESENENTIRRDFGSSAWFGCAHDCAKCDTQPTQCTHTHTKKKWYTNFVAHMESAAPELCAITYVSVCEICTG